MRHTLRSAPFLRFQSSLLLPINAGLCPKHNSEELDMILINTPITCTWLFVLTFLITFLIVMTSKEYISLFVKSDEDSCLHEDLVPYFKSIIENP